MRREDTGAAAGDVHHARMLYKQLAVGSHAPRGFFVALCATHSGPICLRPFNFREIKKERLLFPNRLLVVWVRVNETLYHPMCAPTARTLVVISGMPVPITLPMSGVRLVL